MYRLYYINNGDSSFYWQTGHCWRDFKTIEDCLAYISNNYWDWNGEKIVKGDITVERIVEIEEKEIMKEDDSAVVRAIVDGKNKEEKRLKPILDEIKSKKEKIEKEQLILLKDKYEKSVLCK